MASFRTFPLRGWRLFHLFSIMWSLILFHVNMLKTLGRHYETLLQGCNRVKILSRRLLRSLLFSFEEIVIEKSAF